MNVNLRSHMKVKLDCKCDLLFIRFFRKFFWIKSTFFREDFPKKYIFINGERRNENGRRRSRKIIRRGFAKR